MKEKSKKLKYDKMRNALAQLIEVAGDRKKEKAQLDIFIKESNKFRSEFSKSGMSEVLQRDFNHRLGNAHNVRNKELLVGTAMGYHMILQQTKVWE